MRNFMQIEDSRAKKRCIRVLKDMQKGKTI